ncbi:translation initiation factor EF-1 [Plasmodium ovale curtisi]|uniref:Translation initiation factor EF-1 n=1 Tax=Plasmodium ovale curtisi TaxID=864141 RepID=A0A1A8WZ73_PLAOA|nr:translation initiation factor EF-1 [Plasmodium ovale curtisi]SBS96725.1 translation initiation factor EF-1 [Plasmodium ovale curtisi]
MYITGGACPTSNRKNNLFKKYRCIYNNSRNNLVREKDMDTIEMNGIIDECLANTNFVVRIPNGTCSRPHQRVGGSWRGILEVEKHEGSYKSLLSEKCAKTFVYCEGLTGSTGMREIPRERKGKLNW